MSEYDYKPNSNRFKEEQKNKDKKIEKVVTGNVITKKKSKARKFTEELVSEDAKNVKSYVLGEVLIPAIKKLISDEVLEMRAKEALRSLCYDCEKQMAENGVRCPFRSISNEFCDNYNFLYFIINFKKEDKNNE